MRAAIRRLLAAAELDVPALAVAVRAGLARDDDYASLGKPPCDWDDSAARDALVDALVGDVQAALAVLHGQELTGPLAEAAQLLALVAAQDVEAGEDGVFRIARRVARDRVISTVDTQARHGHKSRARRFDGYKTHLGVDPDDELITNVTVTPANTPDREVIEDLLDDPGGNPETGDPAQPEIDEPDTDEPGLDELDVSGVDGGQSTAGLEVYGDSAYADGRTLREQAERGNDLRAKVPPVRNSRGYSKDQFRIDTEAGTVGCPAGHTVPIRPQRRGGQARFSDLCRDCPLRAACTTARGGRVISINPHEAELQHAKARQREPDWQQAYRAHRPIVERKISHFTRQPWGGRKARCRGQARILTDILTRAGAINLARLAILGLQHGPGGWAIA